MKSSKVDSGLTFAKKRAGGVGGGEKRKRFLILMQNEVSSGGHKGFHIGSIGGPEPRTGGSGWLISHRESCLCHPNFHPLCRSPFPFSEVRVPQGASDASPSRGQFPQIEDQPPKGQQQHSNRGTSGLLPSC